MQMRSNFFVRHNKNPQAGYRPCQGFFVKMSCKQLRRKKGKQMRA